MSMIDTRTEESLPAGRSVGAALEGIQQAMFRRPPQQEPEKKPSTEVVKKTMLDSGFPDRHTEKVEKLWGPGANKAVEMLPWVLRRDFNVILFGDRGPGKTQIATFWAFQRAMQSGYPGRYIKTLDLLSKLKATWGKNSQEREVDVLRPFLVTSYLVLDEFQEQGGGDSEWAAKVLVNLFDHRYDARKVTVIIANLASVEKCRSFISASIISRVEETGGMVSCNWPSYRQSPLIQGGEAR